MNIDIQKIEAFNKKLNSVPYEELARKSEEQAVKDERDFNELKLGLSKGYCSFCNQPLDHFAKTKPCFHWLLWKAKPLRKKYFASLFELKGYHQIEAYLRWVANCDTPIQNINDLRDEKTSSKLIETTIKYENIEWSFSCSEKDFQGHKNKHDGNFPHYHFQMKIDNKVVINFNSMHCPFIDYDEFQFAVESGKIEKLRGGHLQGAGMQTLLDSLSTEELHESMMRSDDESKAQFHVSTVVEAEEGATISEKDIADMIEESRKTGVPISRLIRKLKNVRARTFIEPGPAVPEISKRRKRNNNEA